MGHRVETHEERLSMAPKRRSVPGKYGTASLWLVLVLAISMPCSRLSAQDPEAAGQPSVNPPAIEQGDLVTLPAGTVISVRLADTVDSNKNHIGDKFTGTIDPSVFVGDHVVIPRGTEAHLLMLLDKKGGHIHGHAEVELGLESMVINGTKLDVESDVYRKKQGMIGAKAKGEAKADVGAGTDAAGDVATGSPDPFVVGGPVIAAFRAADVKRPAGTKVVFTLTAPFTFERPPENSRP